MPVEIVAGGIASGLTAKAALLDQQRFHPAHGAPDDAPMGQRAAYVVPEALGEVLDGFP
ncbi:hypothetical protein [Aureimonas sp. AU22]|uniref:hypothetical protein n=1 Tax=Aureimonas sp. AU22 TaxID=1638162 RepID=UPI0012E34814|nr:hypothetical protein [Aureimonas sp. AU22]